MPGSHATKITAKGTLHIDNRDDDSYFILTPYLAVRCPQQVFKTVKVGEEAEITITIDYFSSGGLYRMNPKRRGEKIYLFDGIAIHADESKSTFPK